MLTLATGKAIFARFGASEIAKRLAQGSLWSIFGAVTSRILVLVGMIFVARALGQESFGEFGLIQATLGVFGLMAGIGLGSTATRFVAQLVHTDKDRAGRIIALVFLSTIIAVLLMTLVLAMAADFIARMALSAPHLKTALHWSILLMAATAFRGLQNGILAGLERFNLTAKLNILEGLVSLPAMILLAERMGVAGALLGLTLSTSVALAIGWVLLASELAQRGISVSFRPCINEWRVLTSYSLPSFLANLVATPVLWFSMTLVARSEDGFASLGIYTAAYQWHGPMVFLPLILMSVSIPVLVQEWEAGRIARFRKVTASIGGVTLALSVPPVIIGATLSPWIMSFYGPEFSGGSIVLVFVLAAAPFHALAKIGSGALVGMNRAWWLLGGNIVWGASLLTLTSVLLPLYGVSGLAAAFFFAYVILASIYFLILIFFLARSQATARRPCSVAKMLSENT